MEDTLKNSIEKLHRNIENVGILVLKTEYHTAYVKQLNIIKVQLESELRKIVSGLQVNPKDTERIQRFQAITDRYKTIIQKAAFIDADANETEKALIKFDVSIHEEYASK